jgi:phosphatidylglycerophosphate synthase
MGYEKDEIVALYRYKSLGRTFVKPLVHPLLKVHPDVITWISFVFSIAAGVCFFKARLRWPLLLIPVCIMLRCVCNLLDGMVAIEREITSARGEALQDTVDRLSDSCMLLGAIFSPFGGLGLGIFSMTVMLISSYVGILKKAVGGKREYGGILGKGDRYLLMGVASIGQYLWMDDVGGFHILSIMLGLMIAGGTVTIIQRSLSIGEVR